VALMAPPRTSLKSRRKAKNLTLSLQMPGGAEEDSSTSKGSTVNSVSDTKLCMQSQSHGSVAENYMAEQSTTHDRDFERKVGDITPSSAHPLSACSDSGALSPTPYRTEPVLVMPYVYLGSERNASSKKVLTNHNITHILNVGKECKNHFEYKTGSNAETPFSSQFPVSPLYNTLNMVSVLEKVNASESRAQEEEKSVGSAGQSSLSTKSMATDCEECEDDQSSMRSVVGAPVTASPASNMSVRSSPAQLPALIISHSNDSVEKGQPSTPAPVKSKLSSSPATPEFVPPVYQKFDWSHNQENLLSFFDDAFQFIESARANKTGVLVHCKQGLSRSATLIIAYVMRVNKMTASDAYAFVKSKSPSISPNMGLVYQLIEYEKALGLCKSSDRMKEGNPSKNL
jgi:hypothetical protein